MHDTAVPAYKFTIPSIADGLPLDCRIYHPRNYDHDLDTAQRLSGKKGAIIAHPYAPLGGCQDDPVVVTIVQQLLELGLVVGTFNFRGATGSKGTTSWTGKSERDDYISFVGLIVHYLNYLHLKSVRVTSSDAREQCGMSEADSKDDLEGNTLDLILGGYSYGSLIVTQLPPIRTLLQHFHNPSPGSVASEVLLRASSLAVQTNETLSGLTLQHRGRQERQPSHESRGHQKSVSHHSVVYGGQESTPESHRTSHDDGRPYHRNSSDVPSRIMNRMHMRRPSSKSISRNSESRAQSTSSPSLHPLQTVLSNIRPCYVLISPLLPPLSSFLSLSSSFLSTKPPEPDTLVQNPTLVVFGDADGFTPARRVRLWCKRMEDRALAGKFVSVEVEGVGHFWREKRAGDRLIRAVGEWVGSGSGKGP